MQPLPENNEIVGLKKIRGYWLKYFNFFFQNQMWHPMSNFCAFRRPTSTCPRKNFKKRFQPVNCDMKVAQQKNMKTSHLTMWRVEKNYLDQILKIKQGGKISATYWDREWFKQDIYGLLDFFQKSKWGKFEILDNILHISWVFEWITNMIPNYGKLIRMVLTFEKVWWKSQSHIYSIVSVSNVYKYFLITYWKILAVYFSEGRIK